MVVDITLTVTYFAFLLGFGIIVANLLKKVNVPDTFFLLILGLVLGPTIFGHSVISRYIDMTFVNIGAMGAVPDFLRILALILVVFTGTFNLKWKIFQKFSSVSVNLALVGVIFSTAFLGLFAHLLFGLEPVYALLVGATLSGTGTGVLYAFENTLSKSRKALTIIKVESIFNSPLTVLLPILFLDLVAMEPGAIISPMTYLMEFWQMVVAGVGTGIIIGLIMSKIMKSMLDEYSSLLLFAMALVTYALAENVGGSGMLAVAICGLIAGNMVIPDEDKEEVERFEDQLFEMLRIAVFTMLGAQVMLPFDPSQIFLAFVFFLVVFVSRPIFLIPALGRSSGSFCRRDLILMSFVAPRGIASAAMAPIIAAALATAGIPGIGSMVVNIIFLVILFSVLFSTVSASIMSSDFVMNSKFLNVRKEGEDESECEKEAETYDNIEDELVMKENKKDSEDKE